MKSTLRTAALITLIGGSSASAQLSEAVGMRALVPIPIGAFDLNVGGTLHRVGTTVGPRTPFSFESTLRLPRGSSGFWVGARVEGAPEVDSAPMRPLLGAGFWTTLRRLTVSIGGATHAARIGGRAAAFRTSTRQDSALKGYWEHDSIRGIDSAKFIPTGGYNYFPREIVNVDSGAASHLALWSDVEGRFGWTVGRVSMEAVVGARPRVASYAAKAWTRVGATYPLNDRMSLAVFAGTDPGLVGFGVPSSTFASVALRMRPWRRTAESGKDLGPLSAFMALPEAGGGYRITYLATHAKKVELSGDFDRWRPVAMKQTRDGIWEVSLPLAPGTYRVNVRIDGGRWLPPAGLPQAEDDFNGAVGVLVVR
jgi:hypothetical protein